MTWASLSRVETVVTAQGKLITTTPKLVVQPLETSVIREIQVKVGEVVHRGQVLATLDPTVTQADHKQLETRVSALDAAVNRLRAELGGRASLVADPANPDSVLQQQLFLQRKAVFDATVRSYDAQLASARAALKTSKDEEAVFVQRLETVQSIESMRTLLMNKELGSRLNYLLSHDARLEIESNLARIRGSQIDNAQKVEKVQAERQGFMDDFRRSTEQELIDTLAKRNTAAEDLKKAEFRKQLVVLRAPADSVVLEIADRSIGSVVREAEPMFTLLPEHVPLRAEVNVDGKDVAQVAVGQPVRGSSSTHIHFKNSERYPARCAWSAAICSAPDPKSEARRNSMPSFYRVLVDVREADRSPHPERLHLIPGMTVTAEMKVGDRSVISYFLYPILRGLDESIREP